MGPEIVGVLLDSDLAIGLLFGILRSVALSDHQKTPSFVLW